MKIRSGFVSNSSSSSFVVRGTMIKKADVAKVLDVDADNVMDLFWEIYKKLEINYSVGGFCVKDCTDYFDGDPSEYMIVGINLVRLDDGCVCELPEPNDEKVKEVIKEKLGIDVDDIHTYVQYISNDNY